MLNFQQLNNAKESGWEVVFVSNYQKKKPNQQLLLVLHSIAQLWSNFNCEDLRMVQFPLHPLGTHAEGVQWKLQHLYQERAMKLHHP